MLLLDFMFRFQMLYGESQMTFNIHLLSHLTKSVKLWGPLWAHSAFPFESANGKLLALVKGTKGVANQIVNKFLLFQSIPYFSSKYTVKEEVLRFCSDLNKYPRVKNAVKCDNTTLLDNGCIHVVTQEDRAAFCASHMCIPDEVVVHKRMIKGGLVYSSRDYMQSQRRDESYVKLADGTCGVIDKIISYSAEDNDHIAILLTTFEEVSAFPLPQSCGFVPHISIVQFLESSKTELVPVNRLHGKCMCIKVQDKLYICSFPNMYERD